MAQKTTHEKQLIPLKRIEGQVRGIQKMIEDKRYCIDIVTQLHSVVGAILRVEDNILKKHLEGCVVGSLQTKSELERDKKVEEIVGLLRKFRRSA